MYYRYTRTGGRNMPLQSAQVRRNTGTRTGELQHTTAISTGETYYRYTHTGGRNLPLQSVQVRRNTGTHVQVAAMYHCSTGET